MLLINRTVQCKIETQHEVHVQSENVSGVHSEGYERAEGLQTLLYGQGVSVGLSDLPSLPPSIISFLLLLPLSLFPSSIYPCFPLISFPPSLLQTFDQFLYNGCDNCERYLKMKGNRELVQECTSSNFDG